MPKWFAKKDLKIESSKLDRMSNNTSFATQGPLGLDKNEKDSINHILNLVQNDSVS